MSDRKEFQTARSAGKAIHQAQRLENATYTAVEVKALTKTAADLAYALGRKEALEISAAHLEALANRWEAQQRRWDIGPKDQRGTAQQVAEAWENKAQLRCWAKHLRHAGELLAAPDIGKGDPT